MEILRRLVGIGALLTFAVSPALTQTSPSVAPTSTLLQPMQPTDMWAAQRLGNLQLSPDGQWLVYSQQSWSIDDNKATSHLWLVRADGTAAPRRLTSTPGATDSSPRWSPDGRQIAFTSRRGDDTAPALYLIAVDGGEAEKVLELPLGVGSPAWLPDGSGLIVATRLYRGLASEPAVQTAEAKRRKDSKVKARSTENRIWRFWDKFVEEDQVDRLYRFDLASRQTTDLTPGWDRFFTLSNEGVDFDVAPDGQHVVLTVNSTPPPYRDFLNNDLYLVPTDGSGNLRNLTADNPRTDSNGRFSPDGKTIAYTRQVLENPVGENSRLMLLDVATGQSRPLGHDQDLSIGQIEWSANSQLIYGVAEDRGRVKIFTFDVNDRAYPPLTTTGTVSGLQVARNRPSLYFLHDTISRPAEVYRMDLNTGTELVALTDVNAAWRAKIAFGSVEERWFAGADGAKVHMWVVFPPGFRPDRTYPLVHLLHGGPQTMVRDSFGYRWNPHLFAAPGYVVAWVNRHGSTGFGEKFAQAITGEWGTKPTADILAATDFLLNEFPNLDGERVAAAGASYGGYLAAWLAGATDRFVCLVNHAGVSNTESFFSTDIPHWFELTQGGSLWQNRETLARSNPINQAGQWQTPMLVIHGELDYRVPVTQGYETYAALQARGIPSRMVYYPDENHWVLKPQNSLHWYGEVLGWLKRWLEPTTELAATTVPPPAPQP